MRTYGTLSLRGLAACLLLLAAGCSAPAAAMTFDSPEGVQPTPVVSELASEPAPEPSESESEPAPEPSESESESRPDTPPTENQNEWIIWYAEELSEVVKELDATIAAFDGGPDPAELEAAVERLDAALLHAESATPPQRYAESHTYFIQAMLLYRKAFVALNGGLSGEAEMTAASATSMIVTGNELVNLSLATMPKG